jgi:glycosyltransferase involved in cell wall biosynthesis
MRLLLVTHCYPEHASGVEVVAGELASRLAARGVEIVWAALHSEGAGPEGVTRLPMAGWNVTERRLGFPYPLWGPASLARLSAAVADCDLVHLHDSLYLGNVAAYLAAARRRKPVVVTQHVGSIPFSSPLLRALMGAANRTLGRLVLGGCEQVVFISPRVQQYFARLVPFRRPPLYWPNGVDTTLFHPVSLDERRALRAKLGWPADGPVLLFVGRFAEKKGLPLLRALAGRLAKLAWVFVGRGPHDPARWGLKHVRCPGPLPRREIADCYRAADLLVLPSVGEGFPLVVQEGMACGLPALITPETAEGAPEAAPLLFTAEPGVDAWAQALEALLADPAGLAARREEVADFARRRWSWEACAELYLGLFRSLLGGGRFATCPIRPG